MIRIRQRTVSARWVRALVFVLTLSTVGGATHVAADPPYARGNPSIRGEGEGLEPGDAIAVHSWREPQLSGEYPIDEEGTVVLPLLGVREVVGVPTTAFKQDALRDYATQFPNQEIRVTLLRRVGILGEVRRPGLYHIDATLDLADIIALGGGPTSQGKTREVEIRRGRRRLRVSLDNDITALGPFRSGDQIIIPQRSWLSRHSGILVGAFISGAAIITAAGR
jgi:polysaccharide export outer membrane protein